MTADLTLKQEYDSLSRKGFITKLIKNVPEYVEDNLNSNFKLREYQREAIKRLIFYLEEDNSKIKPSQLLFNMATGSGKTLLMAVSILYLYYKHGYRDFLFFVNSTNIIEKTRDNFLNPFSSKYLFNKRIMFNDKETKVREVKNFSESNDEDINIIFTTIQKLHSDMNTPKENAVTFEDFADKKFVIISDEAHHINAWTKNKLSTTEAQAKNTWEGTVVRIFNSNPDNIMLEYTATVDLNNPEIWKKYKNKLIYEYSLKEFRQDGYSKEVKVLDADIEKIDRMIFAAILSQYRRKIAEKNRIYLKPVVLFKSKTIKESTENASLFHEKIKNLTAKDIDNIRQKSTGTALERAFSYFNKEGIADENLAVELKEDFSEEKCMVLDSENIDEEKQVKLNSLEDENNEIRVIFAVNMLNEGWDTLNLFDIVRLYETRDGQWTKDGRYVPGNTTISEVQLIGRGARYFPFTVNEGDDKFRRKFDQDPENEMKILEELYYHSSYVPKYIAELKAALRESGIMPPQEPKTLFLKVKEDIKKTNFWKNGFIFINQREKTDGLKIESISEIAQTKTYGPVKLKTGEVQEDMLFENGGLQNQQIKTQSIKLEHFSEAVIRKAIAKNDFYRFNNLKKYFPKLDSLNLFIEHFKGTRVDIITSEKRFQELTPDDKLEICLTILKQLELYIKSEYVEYKGSHLFVPYSIKDIVTDKVLNINIGDNSDQEIGHPISDPRNVELRLDLSKEDWYVYDENYGTSEEKYFIRFLYGIINKLKERYIDVFLIRNANLFKIYNFSDGRAIEPDFVLFLKESGNDEWLQYQVFVEAKGTHLLETDQWKEKFLKEIEEKCEIIEKNKNYKLIGMPFYNEATKRNFIKAFEEKFLK